MEKTDPVFQLIDNYCRSYNKANKRKFIFTVITYHYFRGCCCYVLENWYKWLWCLMVAGWGLLLTAAMIMNRRMSLAKLRMEYSYFKNDGHVMGVISDDFLSLLADSGSIDNYAKRRLAEKQQEECGVLRWSDLFEVREEVLKLKERDKRLLGKGAEKLQRYNQQDK